MSKSRDPVEVALEAEQKLEDARRYLPNERPLIQRLSRIERLEAKVQALETNQQHLHGQRCSQ